MREYSIKRWWLYILKLENGKWYVGITSKTPESIELIEDLGVVSKEHAEAYENKVTRSLMKERGLNNVRGGDLREDYEYINRFGWIWSRDEWYTVTLVVALMLTILYLTIDKYL